MASAGARRFRILAIVLVVVVGLLVAADRISLVVAERVAASTIQSSQHLNGRPDVDIDGFPFLTQLASGSFDEVTVKAHDVPVGRGDRTTELSSLTAVLHDVDTSHNFHQVHAHSTTATAAIDYPTLSTALGFGVASAGSGMVKATKSVTVLGRTVTAGVLSRPVLRDGVLSFTDTHVAGAGSVVGAASGELNSLFQVTIPLDQIPFGLRPTSLTVSSGGLAVVLQGADITYLAR